MKYTDVPVAQVVIDHCKKRGIDKIIISPGSRNAPLIIGFTEDPFFQCYSIVDERCASFFALGIVQQTRQPAVLVCTSGSAVLNYYPAVAEAYYSDCPIIVLSADRPPEKIDIGDGQTIRQENVMAQHVSFSANLSLDIRPGLGGGSSRQEPDMDNKGRHLHVLKELRKRNNDLLNQAFNTAISASSPVHVNIPLEEPLYGILDHPASTGEITISGIDKLESPGFAVAKEWHAAGRKIVLVGTSFPGSVTEVISGMLAADPSVIVFTETTSNLHHPAFFPSIDSIIAPIENSENPDQEFSKLQPEILLTFGGMVVSKKVKAFLRKYRPLHHWHIDPKNANDTYFCLDTHFKADINSFLEKIYRDGSPGSSDYRSYWDKVKARYRARRKEYLKAIPFSDMLAFDAILRMIPKGYHVQLSNSSTVRYTQLFDMDSSLSVFCNRGTSGIDGSTSTAVGASLFAGSPSLLLTGDLSFLYDSNALWNSYLRPDFRIIVINNGGGGIFRILPGKEASENFEKFFETVQSLNLGKLCEFYGLSHILASDVSELREGLSNFFMASAIPKVLEVRTPRMINDKILRAYFDFIS